MEDLRSSIAYVIKKFGANKMIWPLITEFIGLIPMFIVVGMVLWRKRQLDKDSRRDPLTTELLRLPGESLQCRLEAMMDKHIEKLVLLVSLGLMTGLLIAVRRIGEHPMPWGVVDTVLFLGAMVAAVVIGLKLTQAMPERRRYHQALRAEQATAQEVAAALIGDNRLIHDVQAGEFNIDHVVITPTGIFAIETKSRLKPPVGNGTPKVKYDGRILDFGSWQETKPIDQATRQAHWLEEYLKRSTGDTHSVTPVLALPGWFVESTVRLTDRMVRVINPKNSQWLLLPQRQSVQLDSATIQRVAFQIEKLAQAPEEQGNSR